MRERRIWFDLNDESLHSPRVAILGLPYDGAVSLRRGAAEGPARIRALSRTADAVSRRGTPIEPGGVRDLGDVPASEASGQARSQKDFFEAALVELTRLPGDPFLIGLGGDNSVSIPLIRAFVRRYGTEVGIVWFDAHPDLISAYESNPDSHACALYRALSLTGIPPRNVVLLGTRSYAREEVEFIRREGIALITAAEWARATPEEVAGRIVQRLRGLPAVYLAQDIDGFDASCAPGTGYPMPGGVGSETFFAVQELLLEQLPVRWMDITEVAPTLDHNDMTSFLGAQLVLEALAVLQKCTR